MKLFIKRDQDSGLLGSISFVLMAKVELLPEEEELIKKYKAHQMILFTKEHQIWGTVVYRIKDLVEGIKTKCKDIAEILERENLIKEACNNFFTYINVMSSFGGEEVIEYYINEEQQNESNEKIIFNQRKTKLISDIDISNATINIEENQFVEKERQDENSTEYEIGFSCPNCGFFFRSGLYNKCPSCFFEFSDLISIGNPLIVDTERCCTNCGYQLDLFYRFCPICGNELATDSQNNEMIINAFCEDCNAWIYTEDRICPSCKNKIEEDITCPECNSIVREIDKFCYYCGEEFE